MVPPSIIRQRIATGVGRHGLNALRGEQIGHGLSPDGVGAVG